MSPKEEAKPWWAERIDVQGQEFDAHRGLTEVVAVQRVLDGLPRGKLTRESYREEYERALLAIREAAEPGMAPGGKPLLAGGGKEQANPPQTLPLLPTESEIRAAKDSVAAFGAEASGYALQGFGHRLVLTVVCPDRRGVVSAVSHVVADHGGNIERSTMAVRAGCAIASFLVSAPSAGSVETVTKATADAVQRFGGPPPMSLEMHPAQTGNLGGRSRRYVLSARAVGVGSLAAAVTEVLAALEFPVTLMAYERRRHSEDPDDVQVLDVAFAARHPAPGESEFDVARSVGRAVRSHLPEVQIRVGMDETLEQLPSSHGAGDRDDCLIAILGHGRPGFVNAVINALLSSGVSSGEMRSIDSVLHEDICVVTAVVSTSVIKALGSTPAAMERSVSSRLRERGFDGVSLCHGLAESDAPAGGRLLPTHELALAVQERPGVIADLSALLLGFGVNIVWLSSAVRRPRFGEAAPECVVAMQVQVPDDAEAPLDGSLRSLATEIGAEVFSLRPWSISGRRTSLRAAEERTREILEATASSLAEIGERIRPPQLIEFDGYVGVELVGEAQSNAVRVMISRGRTGLKTERAINIASSQQAEWVPFEVVVDSDTLAGLPVSRDLLVGSRQPECVAFDLGVLPAHVDHRITVQVRQRNRTIQIVAVGTQAAGPG